MNGVDLERTTSRQGNDPFQTPTTERDQRSIEGNYNVDAFEVIPPDGGYGWVCTFCVFMITVHTWGVNSAWGVILAYFLSNSTFPGAGHLDYAFIGGLSISQCLLIGPIVTKTYKAVGTTMTLLFGTALGYALASAILPPWFSTKRSFCIGIAASGSGIGGLTTETMGWQITYKILAFCALGSNLACSLLLKDRKQSQAAIAERTFNIRDLNFQVCLMIVWGVSTELGFIALIYSLPYYASSIGLNSQQGSVAGAILNLGLAIGRPLTGYISDTFGRITVSTFMAAFCVVFCFAIWIPAQSYASLLIFAILSGMVSGTFWGTITPVTAKVVGLSRLLTSFSMICLTLVIPTTVAEPAALSLVASSGYLNTQVYIACMFVLGALSLWILRSWKFYEIERKAAQEQEEYMDRKMHWLAFRSLASWRRRKKKCDEVRPSCGGCVRNKLSCQWPSSVPQNSSAAATNDPDTTTTNQHRLEDQPSSPVSEGVHRDSVGSLESPSSADSPAQLSCTSDSAEPAALRIEEHVSPEQIAPRRDSSASDLSTLAVGGLVPRSLSMLPGYSQESFQLLSHYLATTAECMANGSTPVNPFLVQIVPLAFTSDLLLQLVLTQSAAHRAFRSRNDSDEIAQSHYTKALQLFRKGVNEFINGKESNSLMLTVGALVMCFTETAKGDINGTIFDHLSAANTLLTRFLSLSDAAVPKELKDFVIEYYTYTAAVSMISIDARVSHQLLLNFELEHRARQLLDSQYLGNLCGCWLELLLLIPCIFDLGRQWMMYDAQPTMPSADEIAMYGSLQTQILQWSPYPTVTPEVFLAGRIFQQAMLLYLYTALSSFSRTERALGHCANQFWALLAYRRDRILPISRRASSGSTEPANYNGEHIWSREYASNASIT
ncbi:MFS general substrate transporter [Aspergillus affinis]|uniref:MFS general substrate transporter n=1 Tax=Aspergillus affinis TaxID=1070780 RepID=UPI0022FE9A3C|nr:MFS general substrate transporter [Aspergillus affinis]KAI9040181.1 MFS general substrate transporter [Aspergillus affinis]